MIKYGATKWEITWGIKESLQNAGWTDNSNFLIISYSNSQGKSYFRCNQGENSCFRGEYADDKGKTASVFVVKHTDRGRPAPDWVEFMWAVTHPSDSRFSDTENTFHAPPINADLNCIPDAYWAYYSAATARFSELNGESVDGPGIWFSYCGGDGNYPVEDYGWENDDCGENKQGAFAVSIAGKNTDFWERYLLDDRRKENKSCNNLSTIIHPNWCSTNCSPNEQQGCADLCIDRKPGSNPPSSPKFSDQLEYYSLGWSKCCLTLGILPDQVS
ncbi:Oidioi.mRNA.OKI2018_I69.PAR.g8785.t1.cds [Oikopleura dioica]|uniref:Oidioi.mRNA.OKI2018_I69.PAR.g8785.t1.cds n=1 Tax=Oikopleura dioica TaxID=34765 RepID=A0ABN7RQ17_OIKDI|nr:Oidioi.mRNA.OKI2018_I69.PAR.g8785.t1.cds [Oikopleura dioica]